MENNNVYTTTVKLNAEEAKKNIELLDKKVQDLVARRDALNKKSPSEKGYFKILTEEINAAKKQLKFYENDVLKTIRTLDNLAGASARDIQQAQKAMQKMLDTMPRDSEQYKEMAQHIREAKAELENIKSVKAFEEVQAGVLGTGKSARQLGAEFRFLRSTMENIGTASVNQLEKALEVARQHFNMAKQGSAAYERAAERIKAITARLEEAKARQKESNLLIDKYDREINAAKKDTETIRRENELIKRTLENISGANIQEIEYSLKIIKENMRSMPRGEAFDKMAENARKLEKELKNVNGEAMASRNAFARIWNGLNRNWGAITQTIGAITGLSATVRSCVEAFAEMDQEMNNVRKYTGQTIEEVEKMNEKFKEMDTRTSREQLNQLAGSAGRLGIQGEAAIMDFVYAADQINIALGDDLGKGAVDQIGKLAMAFGEDDKRGLRNAMLSTGSAVNELAQHSAANAGYLVDFTARLSCVGVQAGLTQAQILGLGAAMDENMQRDEMAATALSQIITKMTTDSAKFARIAGKNVEDFSKLVKEDMNSALMQFFEAMNKKGGFAELAPLFEQMGLDGTRAVGVLSTLASKIEDVKKHQQLATEAYIEHTSVEAEAAIQNDTYQAKLEKVRKAFNDMKVDLGEKLLPVVQYTISGTGLMVKGLSALAGFLAENYKWILTLASGVTAYTIAVNMSAIKIRIWYARTWMAEKAQRALNLAQKASPMGIMVGLISAAATAFALFRSKSDEAREGVQALSNAEEAFNDALKETRRSIEEDRERLRRMTEADEDATEAVRELAEKYPQLVREQMTAAEAYKALTAKSLSY